VSLRELAAADLKVILEDSATGFGWAITVTNPEGTEATLTGFSTDIGQTIDPDTGQAVSGRRASVAIAIASLTDAGLGLPRSIADSGSRPWVIVFDDIHGTSHRFKVAESMPDRAAGVVTCLLEAYRA
jgi:hypothetical protein